MLEECHRNTAEISENYWENIKKILQEYYKKYFRNIIKNIR